MIVFGDCHLGVSRRNKWYYGKVFEMWKEVVVRSTKDKNANGIIFAGDLWDRDTPSPRDLVEVIDTLDNLTMFENNMYVIPGNHDRITIDGNCAAEVINDISDVIVTPKSVYSGCIRYHIIPYTGTLIQDIKDYVANTDFDTGYKHYLVTHLTTKEMLSYAGTISESDPVFNVFDEVILGDYHAQYDHGKFHSIGSTVFCNVDEMASKNCHPSYISIDDNTGELHRVSYEEFDPKVIESLEEAVDPNQLYLIYSHDQLAQTPSNVFVKYKRTKEEEEQLETLVESVNIGNGINKDQIFSIVFPDIDEFQLNLLKKYESGEIDLDTMLSGKIHKYDDVETEVQAMTDYDKELDF